MFSPTTSLSSFTRNVAVPPIKVRHPKSGLMLTFDPQWQSYKFNNSKKLTSVTKILNKFFPFDGDKIAAKLARTQMRTPEEVKAEWKKSIVLGTNVNNHFKDGFASSSGNKQRKKQEVSELHGDEEQYYRCASKAIELLSEKYEVIEDDVLICSPSLNLGGKIDYLCKNKENGNICILDVSVTGSTLSSFRFGTFDDPVPLTPLNHLTNTRLSKFSLEVLLYGMMLKDEEYSKFFGKEIDEPGRLEYGVVQIGKSDSYINAYADMTKIDEDALLPTDETGETNTRSLLRKCILSAAAV